jgi:CheY-like chemotaxis protein
MNPAQQRPNNKSPVVSELAMARAQRNTVMIIDDLFSSRLLLAEIVRQIDGKLNLELFDTPGRALEFARNNRVDMVLTDYKLPEFDGVQLVRQIRALPHCIDVPIVVIPWSTTGAQRCKRSKPARPTSSSSRWMSTRRGRGVPASSTFAGTRSSCPIRRAFFGTRSTSRSRDSRARAERWPSLPRPANSATRQRAII